MNDDAEKAKLKNIIEMAISFSAMIRVFESESDEKIKNRLNDCIDDFLNVKNEEDYHRKHQEFCEWFTKNIKTAEVKKNGEIVKQSLYASWGQAAKIIDIVLKVCIYYCNLPSIEIYSKITPWLNSAIDTALLNYLKENYHSETISKINTLKDIDKINYEELQKIIREDTKKNFNGKFPVQYDDIMWRKLNKRF
jgi:hypothetical protein